MKKEGLFGERLLRWLGSRTLFTRIFGFDHFFLLSMDLGEKLDTLPAAKIQGVRPATQEDIPALERLVKRGDEYRERFENGHICFLGEQKGVVAGMGWLKVVTDHIEAENDFHVRLGERCCWSYDAYVDPAYRLTGMWPAIKIQSLLYARQRGVIRSVCMIKNYNPNAMKSTLRLGYRRDEEVLTLKFLMITITRSRHFDGNGQPAKWSFSIRWGGRK